MVCEESALGHYIARSGLYRFLPLCAPACASLRCRFIPLFLRRRWSQTVSGALSGRSRPPAYRQGVLLSRYLGRRSTPAPQPNLIIFTIPLSLHFFVRLRLRHCPLRPFPPTSVAVLPLAGCWLSPVCALSVALSRSVPPLLAPLGC